MPFHRVPDQWGSLLPQSSVGSMAGTFAYLLLATDRQGLARDRQTSVFASFLSLARPSPSPLARPLWPWRGSREPAPPPARLPVPSEVPSQKGPDPSLEGKGWPQAFKRDNNSPDLFDDVQYIGHKVCSW